MNSEKYPALKMIPSGIYIFTAAADEEVLSAIVVSRVMQLSSTPALIAVALKNNSHALAVTRKSGSFALNLLAREQVQIVGKFITPVSGKENWPADQSYTKSESGALLLEAATGFIDCRVYAALEAGDHTAVIGEVVSAEIRRELEDRPDNHVLRPCDLGPDVYYRG
ncbi:MAG: flavin reductase [Candidatus Dadabacteria bacterium]|nr:MAG: flavin reductase [Candidatus Dadabacteria bacterium]